MASNTLLKLDPPQIVETEEQLYAGIHLTIPLAEIHSVMGPGIMEVMTVLKEQGITPTGPWFTHHFRVPNDTFDFEICVPVSTPVAPVGRVKPCVLSALKVARTVYHGDYRNLGAAWGEFSDWIETEGYKSTATDLWESYLVGPWGNFEDWLASNGNSDTMSNPDSNNWQTQLNKPLQR